MDTLGIYIHIPFCIRKCHYCDFASYPGRLNDVDAYIDSVLKEAQNHSLYISRYKIDTIFIGGGTPSLLSSVQMKKLINGLKAIIKIDVEEFTIEANPETLDLEKIKAYKEIGINRISLGLQSHENEILTNIGRCHTYEDFLKAFILAKEYIGNINVDTIFGLPGQTEESYRETLERLIELSPGHISCYALKLEEGTKLFKTFRGADEETDRQMYHDAVNALTKAEYMHYETSNFAKPGFECRHNLKYWTGKEYLGLGVAASSYDILSRRTNVGEIYGYIHMINEDKQPTEFEVELTQKDREQEYLMLHLRLGRGISFEDYKKNFHKDFITVFKGTVLETEKAGLIIIENESIKATIKGFDLQNTLITEFLNSIN